MEVCCPWWQVAHQYLLPTADTKQVANIGVLPTTDIERVIPMWVCFPLLLMLGMLPILWRIAP
jgi:hypothetical protein